MQGAQVKPLGRELRRHTVRPKEKKERETDEMTDLKSGWNHGSVQYVKLSHPWTTIQQVVYCRCLL